MGYRDLGSHCPAQLQLRSAVLAAIGGDEVWPDGGAGGYAGRNGECLLSGISQYRPDIISISLARARYSLETAAIKPR